MVVHGRKSHEGQPNSHMRRRLLMTRAVTDLEPDASAPNVWLWNPRGAPLEAACAAIGVAQGVIAVIGGTLAYEMFLHCYRAFHLVRAGRVTLPGERRCFRRSARI